MSIFNQNLDHINEETLTGKGSPFYEKFLAGSAGHRIAKALYDFSLSALALLPDDINKISSIRLGEEDDFFRNYLPSLSRICAHETDIYVYQNQLDGGNTEVFCHKFAFCGDELQNLSINAGNQADTNSADLFCKYLNNVKINTQIITFGHSQTKPCNSNHPLGLPKFGDNVYISPDCNVLINTNLAGVNQIKWWRCLDLPGLDFWDGGVSDIRARTTWNMDCRNILPMVRGTRISDILNLPEKLRGLASYVIFFQVGTSPQSVLFTRADQLPQDNLNEVFRPRQTKPDSSAYTSADGYVIIV